MPIPIILSTTVRSAMKVSTHDKKIRLCEAKPKRRDFVKQNQKEEKRKEIL